MSAIQLKPGADTILDRIAKWVLEFGGEIQQARQQDGGWEKWVQVELVFYLAETYDTHYELKREQPVYGNTAGSIDIWLRSVNDNGENLGIEVKCRTTMESSITFKERVRKDIEKVQRNLDRTANHGTLAKLYAVGLSLDAEDLEGWDGDNAVHYHPISLGSDPGTAYMIYYSHEKK